MESPLTRPTSFARRLDGRAAREPLDALVQIAEPLLQPHHRLAAGVEAEMAGLDDSGMNRPDRNLVQRRPLGAAKGIGRQRRRAGGGAAERRDEIEFSVIEPGPRVGRPLGRQAVQIRKRTLQPDRAGVRDANGREAALGAGKAQDADIGIGKREAGRAFVAPEVDEARLAGGEPAGRFGPVCARCVNHRPASPTSTRHCERSEAIQIIRDRTLSAGATATWIASSLRSSQ